MSVTSGHSRTERTFKRAQQDIKGEYLGIFRRKRAELKNIVMKCERF